MSIKTSQIENVRKNIKETLENGSLTGHELQSKVRSNLESLPPKKFYEAIYDLLDEGKICIVGYNKKFDDRERNENQKQSTTNKQKQSPKIGGIVFESTKREYIDVRLLLNQLESSDLKKFKKSRTELQDLFEIKFNQYEKQRDNYWEELKNKVESKSLKFELNKLKKELVENDNKKSNYKEKLTNYIDYLSKIYEKYNNAKIWYSQDISIENIRKIPNKDISMSSLNSNNVGSTIVIDGKTLTLPKATSQELNKRSGLLIPLIDTDGSWDSEKFLNEKGFKEPIKKTRDEKKTIFNKILFHIAVYENSISLKNSFAWALSEEEESMDLFKFLINKINFNDTKNKLSKEWDDL